MRRSEASAGAKASRGSATPRSGGGGVSSARPANHENPQVRRHSARKMAETNDSTPGMNGSGRAFPEPSDRGSTSEGVTPGNPELGPAGWDPNFFVESLERLRDRGVVCGLCQCVADWCVVLPCRHTFCEACAVDALRLSGNQTFSCTYCDRLYRKSDIDSGRVAGAQVDSLVRQLRVKCPNSAPAAGAVGADRAAVCKWTGPFSGLDTHLTQCEYEEAQCDLCGEAVVRVHLAAHQRKCGGAPVTCPNRCGTANLHKSHLTQHLEKECPRAAVPCPYADCGCSVVVARSDLPQHLTREQGTHLDLMHAENKRHRVAISELNGLRQEVAALRALVASGGIASGSRRRATKPGPRYGIVKSSSAHSDLSDDIPVGFGSQAPTGREPVQAVRGDTENYSASPRKSRTRSAGPPSMLTRDRDHRDHGSTPRDGAGSRKQKTSRRRAAAPRAGGSDGVDDDDPDEALLLAAIGGDAEEIEFWLRNGANVNAQDKSGSTPLLLAADHGFVEAVGILISNGADVNHQNSNGWTALMQAAWNGHVDALRMLIRHRADVRLKNRWGDSAMFLARCNGHSECEKMLAPYESGR